MASLDESDTPAGDGRDADQPAGDGRESLERRVRELERENARLRGEVAEARATAARDRELLAAFVLDGMPRDDEEFRRMVGESIWFADVIRDLG